MDNQLLRVLVKNRKEILVQEDALAITSYNELGIFDILPKHENFISLITKAIVIHKTDGSKVPMVISKGLMKVFENNVSIFLDISIETADNKELKPLAPAV